MPEPKRRSALDGVCAPGDAGANVTDNSSVTLAERRDLTMLQIAAIGNADAVLTTAAGAGLVLPAAPNTTASRNGVTALWLGPGRWLAVTSQAEPAALGRRLDEAVAGRAAVFDVSHARTVIRVSGPAARALLAKGCRLDLHPRVFCAGACAQTNIGHFTVLLHGVDDRPTVDLYVARSYAASFWEWLAEAAAEFGCRVAASPS